jgi:CrcB protein
MTAFLLVMLGGAVGAGLRFGIGVWSIHSFGDSFPWGTLIVNLSGGFLMGLLAGAILRQGAGLPVHLLLGVGLLGGFTTFSAFSLEAALLVERGQVGAAALYALVSVIGSIALLFAGLWAGRAAA